MCVCVAVGLLWCAVLESVVMCCDFAFFFVLGCDVLCFCCVFLLCCCVVVVVCVAV